MNAYRLSGTVTADRTITVRVPEASVGDEAEIIVLFPPSRAVAFEPKQTWGEFFEWLEEQPRGTSTAEEEQTFLRQLRNEWN